MRLFMKLSGGLFLSLFLMVFAGVARAEDPGAVTLLQPVGARSYGMAETGTALKGEICALHYNPAGMINVQERQSAFSYQRGIADDNFGVATYGLPLHDYVFGASLLYYDAGSIELTNRYGATRTVKAQQDYVLNLAACRKSFSWSFLGFVTYGVNLKLLHSKLVDEFSATAVAADVGLIYSY